MEKRFRNWISIGEVLISEADFPILLNRCHNVSIEFKLMRARRAEQKKQLNE